MDWFSLTVLFAAALLASLGLAGVLRHALLRLKILDHPNDRSSHIRPTPRGGGLAVMTVVLGGWLIAPALLAEAPPAPVVVLIVAGGLVGAFWFEDSRGLPLLLRLAVQGGAAAAALFFWPGDGGTPLFFQGLLPGGLDLALAGLGWVWFMNLYNFMDGIDGISVAESAAIGAGATLIGVMTVGGEDALAPGIIVAGAMLGFLWWNRPPARLFLGDVGSVPLGFVLGFLLLDFAARGLWAPALILPLYYLADTGLTLIRRGLRGEKIWRAHRDHFYQLAVRRGLGHGQVSGAVAGVNAALVALAVAAIDRPWTALVIAAALTGAFLIWLGGGSRTHRTGTGT